MDDVVNAGRPPGYRVGTLGDVVRRQSGAGLSRWEADAEYDAIRARRDDIDKIAANTGIKPKNIKKVKDHIFDNIYLLDRHADLGVPAELGRLQSDPMMADAWLRLIDGTHNAKDLQLLRHEVAEAWYMRRHGPSYNAGHNAAQRRYPIPKYPEHL